MTDEAEVSHPASFFFALSCVCVRVAVAVRTDVPANVGMDVVCCMRNDFVLRLELKLRVMLSLLCR